MGLKDTQFRTISCNLDGCKNTVTFLLTQEEAAKVQTLPGNEWLKTVRFINTADGRALSYCSDAHEIEAVATGSHNPPEKKKIIDSPANAEQIQLAAQAAAEAASATAAIKAGQPVTLARG